MTEHYWTPLGERSPRPLRSLGTRHLIHLGRWLRSEPIRFARHELRLAREYDAYAFDRDWYCGDETDPELVAIVDGVEPVALREGEWFPTSMRPLGNEERRQRALALLVKSSFYAQLVDLIGHRMLEDPPADAANPLAAALAGALAKETDHADQT